MSSRVVSGLGFVARPEDLILEDGNKLNPQSVVALRDRVDDLARAFNGKISMGSIESTFSQAGNLDAINTGLITTPGANVEFAVKHDLGRVPIGYDVIFQDKSASIFASRSGSWTESTIYLKSSSAATSLRLRLF